MSVCSIQHNLNNVYGIRKLCTQHIFRVFSQYNQFLLSLSLSFSLSLSLSLSRSLSLSIYLSFFLPVYLCICHSRTIFQSLSFRHNLYTWPSVANGKLSDHEPLLWRPVLNIWNVFSFSHTRYTLYFTILFNNNITPVRLRLFIHVVGSLQIVALHMQCCFSWIFDLHIG